MTDAPDHDAVMRRVDRLDRGIVTGTHDELTLARAYKDVVRRLDEARQPDMCSVCIGKPLPGGKPCICGGVGTQDAELHGLRVACFDYEKELEDVVRDALTPEEAEHLVEGWSCTEASKSGNEKLRRIAARAATTGETK